MRPRRRVAPMVPRGRCSRAKGDPHGGGRAHPRSAGSGAVPSCAGLISGILYHMIKITLAQVVYDVKVNYLRVTKRAVARTLLTAPAAAVSTAASGAGAGPFRPSRAPDFGITAAAATFPLSPRPEGMCCVASAAIPRASLASAAGRPSSPGRTAVPRGAGGGSTDGEVRPGRLSGRFVQTLFRVERLLPRGRGGCDASRHSSFRRSCVGPPHVARTSRSGTGSERPS